MKQYTQKQINTITQLFQQGQNFIQANNFKMAEQTYLEILKIAPEITDATNALAYIYTLGKQHNKAVKQLEKLLATDNSNANTHYNLGNNLVELEHYEKAIGHFLNAIRFKPDLIDAYVQTGFAYKKIKNLHLAINYLKDALNFNSCNAKALHLLGSIYAELHDYAQAIKYLTSAIFSDPNNKECQLHYAQTLESANLLHEADIQYHRTCTLFPDYLDAFLAYGDLLVKNRYFVQALECFELAAKLAPNNIDILDDIGSVYLELSDTQNAINYFHRALAKDPKRVTSLVGLHQVYKEIGNLEKAIEVSNQLISLNNNDPTGYLLKARVRKATPDDNNIKLLTKFLENKDLTNDQRIDINFSLGKIFDDQNLYEQAFNFYAAGNELVNNTIQYNQLEMEDYFQKLSEVFDTNFFERRLTDSAHPSSVPIVIIGMPRSGTTLTEQIISSHPNVFAAGEANYWGDVVKKLSFLDGRKVDYPSCLHDTLPQYASRISNDYLSELLRISGCKSSPLHITDKMPQNFMNIGLIAAFFPNAKIIHTKRDSIDTCLSIFFQNFKESHTYAFNLKNIGHYYNQYIGLMEHWHRVLPGRILDINYTDTVSDPEYWSRALISHIGLEWDDACLSPHKLERSVKTASHWQVRQPIYKSSVQRWKHYEQYLEPLISALQAKSVIE